MRVRTKPVVAAVSLALLGMAGTSHAQSTTGAVETIEVTGIRASLEKSIAVKKDAETNVAVVTAADVGKMQGLFGAAWAVAGLIGPMAGGVIVHYLSWHWVFFINIPFGILAAILLVMALHESIEKKSHVLDVAGASLLTACVTALLFATTGASLSITLGGVLASALLFGAFAAVEKRATEPVLPATSINSASAGSTACRARSS